MFEEEKEQNEYHSVTIPKQIECHMPSGLFIRTTANTLGTDPGVPTPEGGSPTPRKDQRIIWPNFNSPET